MSAADGANTQTRKTVVLKTASVLPRRCQSDRRRKYPDPQNRCVKDCQRDGSSGVKLSAS